MTELCSTPESHTIGRRTGLATLWMVVSLVCGSSAFAQGRSGEPAGAPAAPSASREKRDSMTITIAPFQRTEVKLEMTKGQKASYRWKADAADVTFNLHGEGPDAPGGRAYSYARGSSRAETGEIVALFDGDHGWSWRNTSDKPVKIVVTAWGQFQKLKQP